MNVAMKIIEQLKAWDVKSVFGFIGDDIFYLMDALGRQEDITFYQVKHEESAALMASAHAKLTGQLGVCIADGGPGTLHLLNGLADSYIDGVPLLAITGQVSLKDIGTNAKQYLNQQLIMSPITCYSDMIAAPEATIKIMEKAYRKAIGGSSVAHITIPMDILAMPCQEKIVPLPPYLTNYPLSAPDVINGALDRMKKAKQPIIVVGEGGRNSEELISELASIWGAGLITTLAGTGTIHKNHPLYIGGLGHAGSPVSSKLLIEADLCLIIGANWWPEKYVPKETPIIEIDKNPANLGATTPLSYGLVGESDLILRSLIEGININTNLEWQDRIKGEIKGWLEVIEAESSTGGSPIHPASIVKTLEKFIPPDSLICLDTGDNTVWFGRIFRPSHHRILLSGKWRTMGFGLPAALGAKITYPDQKVLAVVGDGGFAMTMAEFLTAVRYDLEIIVLVLNNQTLAMEKNKMLEGDLIPKGTEIVNPDFAAYANICGGTGLKVNTIDELEGALSKALNTKGPVLLDIATAPTKIPDTTMPS